MSEVLPLLKQSNGSGCVILHDGETFSTTKGEVSLFLSLLVSGLHWSYIGPQTFSGLVS